MRDPFEVMPRETAMMFRFLETIPSLNDFVLIGGTALALHLGHRTSEDLDFITTLPRLPRAVLRNVEEMIRRDGHTVVYRDIPASVDDFEKAGMDLHDYSQNWLIDESVKVTFFTADEHHKRVLADPNRDDRFRVGSLDELSALKALVACERSKSRDWVDLFILERDHGFGLAQWKGAYDKAGLTSAHFERALNRICEGARLPTDEGFSALLSNPPSLDAITSHFRALREAYELSLAKQKLQGPEMG